MTGPRPMALIVTPDFPPAKGGIQILSHRIASSLARFTPIVVTLGHSEADAFDQQQAFRIVRVTRVSRRHAPNMLSLNAAAIAVALRERPAVVLSVHIVASPAAVLVKKALGIPFVQYVHAKELGAKPKLARFALERADRVIAVSRYTRGLSEAAGAVKGRIVLISPGVDLPSSLKAPRPANGRPTILTISRLEDRYKGHDVLLRAMPLVRAKIADAQWVVLGDGPLRATLEDRAGAVGIQNMVEFRGAVSDEDRDQAIRHADVFCMVSRLPAGDFAGEGFGIVYLEANSHGLPVVAGAVGGPTDAVLHRQTGLLVDPEDPVAVADALVELLSDPDLAGRLGRGGRRHAAHLSWHNAAARLEDEFMELLV